MAGGSASSRQPQRHMVSDASPVQELFFYRCARQAAFSGEDGR
jgi:hypothetical protein